MRRRRRRSRCRYPLLPSRRSSRGGSRADRVAARHQAEVERLRAVRRDALRGADAGDLVAGRDLLEDERREVAVVGGARGIAKLPLKSDHWVSRPVCWNAPATNRLPIAAVVGTALDQAVAVRSRRWPPPWSSRSARSDRRSRRSARPERMRMALPGMPSPSVVKRYQRSLSPVRRMKSLGRRRRCRVLEHLGAPGALVDQEVAGCR